MLIKNFEDIAGTREKKLALSLIERGLAASFPDDKLKTVIKNNCLHLGNRRLPLKKYDSVHLIAIGKAADRMAKVANSLTRIKGGVVVIPRNMHSEIRSKKFEVIRSGHPIPTPRSVFAAKRVVSYLGSARKEDLVIFLISGGASSLVSLPDGIPLKDKRLVTTSLLKSGASIGEVNCVRKHLSKIKGGRMVNFLNCTAVSLVMSDVVRDDLSVIASGMTFCDRSTFLDAKRILLRYHLYGRVPRTVWDRIILGTEGKIPETPKKPSIENYVITSNRQCLDAMQKHARRLGMQTRTIWPIEGNITEVVRKIVKNFPTQKNSCLFFGGESTVTVKGKGRGGRNQDLTLRLLKKMKNRNEKIVAISVGTDGIDGNSPAAGAIADPAIYSKEINNYLAKSNSYGYFRKYGGNIFTGPTHTNVMDIGLILRK